MSFSQDPSSSAEPNDSPQLGKGQSRVRKHELGIALSGAAIAAASLGLSSYNLAILQQEPEVDVSLPHVVRITQADWAEVILQPTVSTRFKTERVEVITSIELRLHPTAAGTQAPKFYWSDSGYFTFDLPSREAVYHNKEDPRPLFVRQDSPQQPTVLFVTFDAWKFTEGRYEGSLTLRRASDRKSITKQFCLLVTKKDLAEFRKSHNLSFRDDLPTKATPNGCYLKVS